MKLSLWFLLFSTSLFAASVRTDRKCPASAEESCRWEIRVAFDKKTSTATIDWDKSVVSRHVEKPLAAALHCNVDRSFDAEAGGYIKVWFENETEPCDPTKGDPSECGVTYLFGSEGPGPFPSGFTAKAPIGKKLRKVEHFSTLNLQCGNFADAGQIEHSKWNAKVGWTSNGTGDGTFAIPERPARPRLQR